jgi:hypothetical protein
MQEREKDWLIDEIEEKISILSRRHYLKMPTDLDVKTIKISNILSTYEWDDDLEHKPGFWLSIILEEIDANPDLFPITEKLKQMLQNILPNINKDVYVALVQNNDLINLCNDIGLIEENKFKLEFIFNIHLRKGMGQEYPDFIFFKYIKSVMITI